METHLNFNSNSLSKFGYAKSILAMLLFQSKKNQKLTYSYLSKYFNVDKSSLFLFGAARMGIYSVLKALSLKSEDEVIVAGYTCVVLTNAIKFSGAKVQYCDINLDDFNPSFEELEKLITKKTKAIVIPHNFGIPFQEIRNVKENNPQIIIIEDVAHSFSSNTNSDEKCGTIGDAAIFSFEYSKPITSGLGGLLIVNNNELKAKVEQIYSSIKPMPFGQVFKMICTLGVLNLCHFKTSTFFKTNGFRFLKLFKLQYETSKGEIEGVLPKNYPVKINSLSTCLLSTQLRNIEEINSKKEAIALSYQNAFSTLDSIKKIEVDNLNLVRYPIVFKEDIGDDIINNIKKECASAGYHFGVWFNDVVHPKGSFRYCYSEGDCPNGEWLSNRMLNLPVNINYPLLDEELNFIKEVFTKNGVN